MAAAFAAYCYSHYFHRPQVDSVVVVDHRDEAEKLLDRRATGATPFVLKSSVDGEPSPFVWESIPVDVARVFFPLSGLDRPYNDQFYYARPPNKGWFTKWEEHPKGGYVMRTNDLGIREDTDPSTSAPDLRVIVTGDSHTDGVCGNDESFPNRLEAMLAEKTPGKSLEVLNMGIGGYTFWNYLGVLRTYAPKLKPNVFVVACYGGNDFYEVLGLERYFHHRKAGSKSRLPESLFRVTGTGLVAQELTQVGHMLSNPEDIDIAIDTANSITREMIRVAAENHVKLVAVYIPPASVGQPEFVKDELDTVLKATDWKRDDVTAIPNRLADGWISYLRNHEVPCLDLRPIFASTHERLYWKADLHINLAANERIARELEKLLAP